MSVSVRSRAVRILGALENYSAYEAVSDSRELQPSGELGDVLGVYDNGNSVDGKIFVCEKGLRIRNEYDNFVLYSEINKVIYEGVCEIIGLKMKNATLHDVRIAGRNGMFFDATEFVRFLDRVVADYEGL